METYYDARTCKLKKKKYRSYSEDSHLRYKTPCTLAHSTYACCFYIRGSPLFLNKTLKTRQQALPIYNYTWRNIPSELNLYERRCERPTSRANQHLFYHYDNQSVECGMRDMQGRNFSRKTEEMRHANPTLNDGRDIENVS